MNKNDPWASPKSYEPEAEMIHPRKFIWDNAHLLFGLIVLCLLALGVALCSAPVRAAELGDFKDKPLSIMAALCVERADADTLLGHVEHGGTKEGLVYLKEPNNTCILGPLDIIVGETLDEGNDPQQVTWLLVAVSSQDGSAHAFMVSMKVLKTNVKSSDI